MTTVNIPPIKSQGIKSKLVPWILELLPKKFDGVWIEPFAGTCVVGLNTPVKRLLLYDANPHIIKFYKNIQENVINSTVVKQFLEFEGAILKKQGEEYYYFVRERFNKEQNPLDFLFLNRCGFNGIIRFNKRGELNVPFCKKTERFSKAYITKIVNQTKWFQDTINTKEVSFECMDFSNTIEKANAEDILYCDPPYIGRHVDYHNGWSEENEKKLFEDVSNFSGKFIMSTWHSDSFKENKYINLLWKDFNLFTRDHFYYVGGKEENRKAVTEALITNFRIS